MNLDGLTPQQMEDALHSAVCNAGFAFTRALWGEQSLTKAWPLTDPELRRCMAQAWLHGQKDTAYRAGFDPDDVVEAFAADRPDHPLWCVFEELQLPDLLAWRPGAHEWMVTAEHKLIALDTELLYMLPRPAEGDVVPVGTPFLPLVMRHDERAGWRVLNFLSDALPEPGWPPRM
ncbi:hypothetical protein ACWGJ6_02420 [Streptomyces canus]